MLGDIRALAEEILRRCPGIRIVATSRRRLGIAAEQVLPLAPLPVPDCGRTRRCKHSDILVKPRPVCVPASLSQPVGLSLGSQAGESRLRAVLAEAGYSHIRRAAENQFNMVLEARP